MISLKQPLLKYMYKAIPCIVPLCLDGKIRLACVNMQEIYYLMKNTTTFVILVPESYHYEYQ